MLNELQKDLLTELVNVYIGQAAAMLSEMVNHPIVLNIPEVELVKLTNSERLSQTYPGVFSPGHIISSSLKFGPDFRGKAFLIFPAQQAKILVNACTDEMMDINDIETQNLIDTDFDVLKEIGNIILNAIIGQFGDLLEVRLEYSIPEIELIHVSAAEQQIFLQQHLYMLVFHTVFNISEMAVEGVILIALTMNSVSELINKIDDLLEETYA